MRREGRREGHFEHVLRVARGTHMLSPGCHQVEGSEPATEVGCEARGQLEQPLVRVSAGQEVLEAEDVV